MLIKRPHHTFDTDKPGKDSYELRKAGASQVLVGSDHRWALVVENDAPKEPTLTDLLDKLYWDALDLVIVEGFKKAPIPKIEIHRPSLGQPLLAIPTPISSRLLRTYRIRRKSAFPFSISIGRKTSWNSSASASWPPRLPECSPFRRNADAGTPSRQANRQYGEARFSQATSHGVGRAECRAVTPAPAALRLPAVAHHRAGR